jgi:hypothetical protein
MFLQYKTHGQWQSATWNPHSEANNKATNTQKCTRSRRRSMPPVLMRPNISKQSEPTEAKRQ